MRECPFKSGDHVKWNQFEGYVNFVSIDYFTITLTDSKPEYPRNRLNVKRNEVNLLCYPCLLYTSPSPRDPKSSRMPSSA